MAPKKKADKRAASPEKSDAAAQAAPEAVHAEAKQDPEEMEAEEEYAGEEGEEEIGGEPDDAMEPEDADAKKASTAASASKEGDADGTKGEDDEDDAPAEKPKGKERPKELEVDAEPDERERVGPGVGLSEYDSTLDVFFSGGGNIVSSLSQGGFQHLLSGVRANTGVKAGRHYFEVKVLEKKSTDTENTLRLGVSTARSSLFLGDGTPDNAGFDMDGTYFSPTLEDPHKRQGKAFSRKIQFQVIGILLNLDSGSPNANSFSVFLDGVRLSEPMPLPAHLVGKALYPTVTFKNFTLAVNLGGDGLVMKHLPFKCGMFGNAAAADTESCSFATPSAGSKYSVVVPVGLPDEGFFDYVDRFLEGHPEYVELSDRKLMEWCVKSGLSSWKNNLPSSRDRPAFNFGIPSIDNKGIRHSVRTLTQLVKRHYVVAELKGNLIGKEREEVLSRFSAPHFSVTAHVAVGEPKAEHKDWVHAKMTSAFEKKQADAQTRKRVAEERRQERAKAIAERKAKGKSGKDKKEGDEEVKAEEEEKADEESPAKKQKTEDDEEAKAEDKVEAGPDVGPHVWWIPQRNRHGVDMMKKTVAESYSTFTLPADSEGFEKVEFVWASQANGAEHLQKFATEKKATLIIEGLKPGEWFRDKYKAWQQTLKEMKAKKPAQEKVVKKEKPAGDKVKDEDTKEEEKPEVKEEEEKAVDPLHAGGEDGKALYADFKHEDWVLLSWRYEMHLLAHAFITDAKDVDLGGMPTEHIWHYYKVYYNRQFNTRSALGAQGPPEVVEMMDDVMKIETKGKMRLLVSLLDKETEPLTFIQKVEEYRQDRLRRIEAGDESCRLKIPEASRDNDRQDRKGRGKGKKGRKDEDRHEGKSSQEKRGQFVKQKTSFGQRQFARRQETKGSGKKGGKREAPRPAREVTSRPWDRKPAAQGSGKSAPAHRPHFENRGVVRYQQGAARQHQDSRGKGAFERGRVAPQQQQQQQDRRHPPAARKFASASKGAGRPAPRSFQEPEAKRPRYNAPPPVPPRAPQVARPVQNSPRPGGGPPSRPFQRSAPPPAPSPASRPSTGRDGNRPGYGGQSKGGHRDASSGGGGHHVAAVASSSRDAGAFRPSSSSSKGGHQDRGSYQSGRPAVQQSQDRRPSSNDAGKDRGKSGGNKGGAAPSGRDDRRDGRDRGGGRDERTRASGGHPSSGGHRGGERDRDHSRRTW